MRARLVNEKFTEGGDPVEDMGISINSIDKLYNWDWRATKYPFRNEAEILDIIDYRGFHLKIMKVTKFEGMFQFDPFYIAITDIGEPYVGDGPYTFDTPEEAIKSGKSGLDNYIDD
jgi:hypothetical protein